MSQTPIQATDTITIEAAPAEVWRVLVDVASYPQWWPRSLGLRLLSDGKGALGSEVEVRPFGGRPFRCRVEEVSELKRIRMRYFGGFIEGTGEWMIEGDNRITRVSYRLDVVAHGMLVRLISKVTNLGALHSRSMKDVLRNLEAEVRKHRG